MYSARSNQLQLQVAGEGGWGRSGSEPACVTQEQVRQSYGRRPMGLDTVVTLSFVLLYGWIASAIARMVCRIYIRDDGSLAGLGMTIYISIVVSAAGVLLGELWSLTIESLRLSNGHLSYRTTRIPLSQHRLGLFVLAMVIFWLLAALHQRVTIRDADGRRVGV